MPLVKTDCASIQDSNVWLVNGPIFVNVSNRYLSLNPTCKRGNPHTIVMPTFNRIWTRRIRSS